MIFGIDLMKAEENESLGEVGVLVKVETKEQGLAWALGMRMVGSMPVYFDSVRFIFSESDQAADFVKQLRDKLSKNIDLSQSELLVDVDQHMVWTDGQNISDTQVVRANVDDYRKYIQLAPEQFSPVIDMIVDTVKSNKHSPLRDLAKECLRAEDEEFRGPRI